MLKSMGLTDDAVLKMSTNMVGLVHFVSNLAKLAAFVQHIILFSNEVAIFTAQPE